MRRRSLRTSSLSTSNHVSTKGVDALSSYKTGPQNKKNSEKQFKVQNTPKSDFLGSRLYPYSVIIVEVYGQF